MLCLIIIFSLEIYQIWAVNFMHVCVTCKHVFAKLKFDSFVDAADGKRNQNGVGADCDDLGLSGRYC